MLSTKNLQKVAADLPDTGSESLFNQMHTLSKEGPPLPTQLKMTSALTAAQFEPLRPTVKKSPFLAPE